MQNFRELEEIVLARWKAERAFEKSLENRKDAKPFVFFEGPPTANGRPHIGHVLVRAYKDVICRYKTMAGFFVGRKAGWDTHGLPVELEVEKKLGLKSKKDIEAYGVTEFNKKCKESVWTYRDEWEKLTDRMGFWLDMKRPYITYDSKYMESLWWIIKQVWDGGFLYQGRKVVPYCVRCGTGLSSHEVALGYKSVTENSIYVKFKLKPDQRFGKYQTQQSAYVIAWTTTPWTLPANLALAVGGDISYTALRVEGVKELHIIASDRVSAVYRNKNVEIVHDDITGNDLVGMEYEPLCQTLKEENPNAHKIYAADFVSTSEGTGIIHIAPMYGEDDYNLGKEHGLPDLHTVELDGTVKRGLGIPGEGKFVKDADADIAQNLEKRGLLLKTELYTHDYPFCWRCDSALLYYAKPSWFIAMSKLREKLIENNTQINWIPEHMKEGRFGEWLKDVKDWNLSRERYWGTPLPIWECEACNKRKCVGSYEELDRLALEKSGNTYYLMRHGEAESNVANIVSMRPDDPLHLTETGKRQVGDAAEKLAAEGINFVFSSDFVRTRETAEIIAEKTGAELVFDERLREINGGKYHGKPNSAYHAYFEERGLNRFDHAVDGGETWADLRRRMMLFWLECEKKHQGKRILIVSHGDPLWVLGRSLSGFDDDDFREIGVTAIKRDEYPQFAIPQKISYRTLPYDEDGAVNVHRPYVDEFFLRCGCGKKMARIKELADVWFDSGAMPFAQAHWPFAFENTNENRNKLAFPADYICEAIDQTRGWFYTLLAVSTLLERGASYKNVISLSHVLDSKGQKMSKSRGNVVDPWSVIEKYGVDALRWYFFTANNPGDYKLFDEKHVAERMRGFLNVFWNCVVFWRTYSKKQITNNKKQGLHVLDRWVLSVLNDLVRDVREKLDAYDVTGAARSIEHFVVGDLSQWYVRRSRERLQESEEAMQVFGTTLATVVRLAAPLIPFVADGAWKELGNTDSVHLEDSPLPQEQYVDNMLERAMGIIRIEVTAAHALRAEHQIKIRQPLASFTSSRMEVVFSSLPDRSQQELTVLLADEINVKEILFGPISVLDVQSKDNPELKLEGDARELVRQIQGARKKTGLKPREEAALVIGDADAKKLLEHPEHGKAIIEKTFVRSWVYKAGSELAIQKA